eukprot:CAMPEP_0181121750 /NCGR_PEP_ID=MMETSP1071-20121207/24917_1 /TAXON_ID=35127 /ORGANISM="Thalassiosira sp., Strain NH16" /LENGTH=534 /DNA_ID=CAMNT_0023206615 /DNA_START=96 /DNA_END=1697 /DNA_ORIENTATION=+
MKGMSAHRPSFKPSRANRTKPSPFLKNDDGSIDIGSGILSPVLSMSGSTTVTPITPMTPLTTPRTPLEILLGKQYHGVGVGPYRRQPSITQQGRGSLSDDQEEDDQYREKQLLALRLFANFLNTAETTLNDITERENSGHQVLGPGIVRVCNDLADQIEGVAGELHKEHIQAVQHLEQVWSDHDLVLIEEGEHGVMEEKTDSDIIEATRETALALSNLTNSESMTSFQSHEEFISTLSTTHTLLLDMAAALRAISQQEAQELGEVALEVARMFIWSLGAVHSNMIQRAVTYEYQQNISSKENDHEDQQVEDHIQKTVAEVTKKQQRVTWSSENTKCHSGPHGLVPVVEILGEEEKKDEHYSPNHTEVTPTKSKAEKLRYSPHLSPIPSPSRSSPPLSPSNSISGSKLSAERVRVLWPPLLPAVAEVGKHCAQNAKDHPIPAIAIGLTCGPAAIATAAIAGPPLLVADWAIQNSYDALSEHTPVIENVEKGTANALQVARLGILCSKLIVKQGMSIGERQIERRGGVGKICSDVV